MEPYIGEIRTFAFNSIPRGWAPCNGQVLAINQNQALFSLLGTQYGGNGTTTFNLPNLQGTVMQNASIQRAVGFKYGSERIALTKDQIPRHNHRAQASSRVAKSVVGSVHIAQMQFLPSSAATALATVNAYTPLNINLVNTNLVMLHPNTIPNGGASAPHENRSPYLTMSICIATTGIFPSRD